MSVDAIWSSGLDSRPIGDGVGDRDKPDFPLNHPPTLRMRLLLDGLSLDMMIASEDLVELANKQIQILRCLALSTMSLLFVNDRKHRDISRIMVLDVFVQSSFGFLTQVFSCEISCFFDRS